MQAALELAQKIHDRMGSVRADADRWITVNSGHGEGGGTPALIGQDGTVKGGMGGKFNGLNIKQANKEGLSKRQQQRAKASEHHAKLRAKQESHAAPKAVKSADLGHSIKQLGGIDLSEASDILGDKPTGAAKFAFKKNGAGIDDLATKLKDEGYPIDTDTVDGGVQQLKDLIREHFNGNRVTTLEGEDHNASHDMENAARDELWAQAENRGITVTRTMGADTIQAAIDYHDAREEAESLGIKVTSAMTPDHIYGLVSKEMDNRAIEAEKSFHEKEAKKAARRITGTVSPVQKLELTGQTNAEILEQEAKEKEVAQAKIEEANELHRQKLQRDTDEIAERTKSFAGNSNNFVFGENSKEASKPMGNLF